MECEEKQGFLRMWRGRIGRRVAGRVNEYGRDVPAARGEEEGRRDAGGGDEPQLHDEGVEGRDPGGRGFAARLRYSAQQAREYGRHRGYAGAWANANLVLLLRDMLLNERGGKLHLLAGLEESWVPEGKAVTVDNAPVTTGGSVSLRVERVDARHWRISVDPRGQTRDFVVHLPNDDTGSIGSVRVDGKLEAVTAEIQITTAGKPSVVEVELR